MGIRPVASTRKSRKPVEKIKEISVEDYLDKRVRALGGITYKNNPGWYIGIGDRTVCVLGYMCMAETKRPKGGRLSTPQKFWKRFLTDAGCPWHLITSHEEVDEFIAFVEARAIR
jgi:hypothetical protein